MRSRVLIRAEQVEGGWVGDAYGAGGVIAIGAGRTEEDYLAKVRSAIGDYIAVDVAFYLAEQSHAGSRDVTICPEAAIKRPIDSWVCKIAKQSCPIQGQVFVKEPERFFAGCLVDRPRKESILRAINKGSYSGFHHVPGRYLCPRCENERGSESGYSYHYPWELSSLEHFAGIDVEKEMPQILSKLMRAQIPRSAVSNALCAPHSLELATLLYPSIAATLRVLEFEISRP